MKILKLSIAPVYLAVANATAVYADAVDSYQMIQLVAKHFLV